MNPITFRVIGDPKAQPRPRAFARKLGDKFSARVYTPGTAEAWKGEIARVAESHRPPVPFDGPVPMSIDLLFCRPACHFGSGRNAAVLRPSAPRDHLCKPDVDNCAKCFLDCLKTIGFFRDDGQVTGLTITKRWAERGERAGAEITITPLDAKTLPGIPAIVRFTPSPAVPSPLFAGGPR